MLEYQEDIINNEAQHIENFCAGFESIIVQYRNNGTQVEIGGCEAYTTTVMKANDLNWDATKGLEGFLGDGIKKIYEMIKNFFKGIWNFFFGSSKVVSDAKKNADDIETILKDSNFKRSLNESLANASLSMDLAMQKARRNGTNLDQLEADLKKDREASKMIDNAVGRIGAVFSYKIETEHANAGKYRDELDKFGNTMLELLGTSYSYSAYRKLSEGFSEISLATIRTNYSTTRAEGIVALVAAAKVALVNSESALKELERTVEGIRHKAEKEKTRDTEYKAQQALRLVNLAMRRTAHILTVLAKNIKIINEQTEIIKKVGVFA